MSETDVRNLLIVGAGGAAREIAGFAGECSVRFRPVAFVDGDDSAAVGGTLAGLPVLCLAEAAERFSDAMAVIAIGSSRIRRTAARQLAEADVAAATLVHRSVVIGQRVNLGEGSILAPGVVVTSDVRVGRHVYINIGCTVSHDCVIGDFATIAPGASIPGSVHVGEGAFVGVGASLVNGSASRPLRIGRDAVVGAGACVTHDVAPETTVAGVPARPLGRWGD